jgi:hypothetical protein
MMYWQAITNKTLAIGANARLLGDYNRTGAQPIASAIGFRPANPKRRMLASFVQIAVCVSASLGAVIAGAPSTKLPRLALERLYAVFAYKLHGGNPLVVSGPMPDRRFGIAFRIWTVGVHFPHRQHTATLSRTYSTASTNQCTLRNRKFLLAYLAYPSSPYAFFAHCNALLIVYIIPQFGGSGTVARVAERLQRNAILIELNPAYIELQEKRTDGVQVELFV